MTTTCDVCTRTAKDSPCHACWKTAVRRLAELPAWWRELEVTFTRQARLEIPEGHADRVGKLDDPTTWHRPYHGGAAKVAHHVRAGLVAWVKLAAEDLGAPLPADTVPAMALHLTGWATALRRHEAAPELCHEVAEWTQRMTSVVDHPLTRARIHVGPCPRHDSDGDPCGGEVWAVFPFRADEGSPMMGCDSGAAEHFWEPIEWTRAGREIDARRKQLALQRSMGGAA